MENHQPKSTGTQAKKGSIIDRLKDGQGFPSKHNNPYLEVALELEQELYTQQDLEKLKKNQTPWFPNPQLPVVVEIGCYMGKNILEFAQQNPLINFMGLDITYKRVVKSAKKIKQNNLQNARISICDGQTFFEEFVPAQSLSGICLFFPDPWPKEKQQKNRILNEKFAKKMNEKLKNDGFFWFKTDSLDYFTQGEKILLEQGYIKKEGLIQPQDILGGPYETSFQKLFQSQGVPFYQGVFFKKESLK